MTPSIDTAQNTGQTLKNFCGGYLLGKIEEDDLLKDPNMIKELRAFSEQEKQQVFFNMDAVIREIKNRKTYSQV